MFSITTSGSFKNTEAFLSRMKRREQYGVLERFALEGIDALRNATPRDTGATAESWYYTIKQSSSAASITWHNRYTEGGAPVAVLIQYGHGTRNGGYVQGRDYINPAIRPVFDKIANEIWREVTK